MSRLATPKPKSSLLADCGCENGGLSDVTIQPGESVKCAALPEDRVIAATGKVVKLAVAGTAAWFVWQNRNLIKKSIKEITG